MKKLIAGAVLAVIFLSACASQNQAGETFGGSSSVEGGMGMGRMAEMSSGMMDRHHATLPDEYAELSAPEVSEEAIERGAEIYAIHCLTCHGGSAMGDGPGGTGLEPAPAPIAHTSLRMTDAYLYWRISEGGGSFGTAMPAWKETLDEQARWDVIHYVRALGRGDAEPASDIGQAYEPGFEAAQQAAMLAQAVDEGVISEAEAQTFADLHTKLETYLDEHTTELSRFTMQEREATAWEALVQTGEVTQAQVDAFNDIHDRLTR